MKVFISWSGKASEQAAIALKGWLPTVIQAIDPFVSSEDIKKGSRWFSEIGTKLEDYNFGILCLTPSNLNAPWLLFEAGALSKKLGESLVTPLLFGLSNSDIEGPLAQFQTTSPHKDDIYKLISTMNKQPDGKEILSNNKLETSFDKWWPDIEVELKLIDAHAKKEAEAEGVESKRKPIEIMKEILDLSRSTVHQLNAIKKAQPYNLQNKSVWDSGLYKRAIAGTGAVAMTEPIAGDDIVSKGGILANLIEEEPDF